MSSPLRDRFGQHYHLDFYAHVDLTQIIQRSAHLLGVRIDDEGAVELAARSRGTPRIADRLLRRVRDFAQVNEASVVTREVALGALELLEIDACGFDKMDRAILAAIIDKFDGGPVGVDTRLPRSARNPTRLAMSTSPTSCRRGSSVGRRRPRRHATCVCASEPHPPRYIAVERSKISLRALFGQKYGLLKVGRGRSALVPALGDVTSKLSWYRGFAVISLLTPLARPRLWQRESQSNPSVQATDSHRARDQFPSASPARRLAW